MSSKQEFHAGFKVMPYTGDGGATQAISGVGFEPNFVMIYPKVGAGSYMGLKSDEDGLNTLLFRSGGAANAYETDHIISLDSDGFTVGDGTGGAGDFFNVGARDYVAICYAE